LNYDRAIDLQQATAYSSLGIAVFIRIEFFKYVIVYM